MNFGNINLLAALVAAVAGFGVGAIWYTLLFSKPWMAALGMTEEKIRAQGGSPLPFVISIVGLIVMALVLAVVVGSLAVPVSLGSGLLTGAVAWLGFTVTAMAVNHGFENRPATLTLIDGGHWLVVLLVQGAIIGAFG